MKNLVHNFAFSKTLAGKIIDIHTIIEHLEILKNLLIKLEKEDLS